MIEIQKNYKLTLTEIQAQELYQLLQTAKASGHITPDYEICTLYGELKKLFDTGIR
jgi:hypothetical protein